MKRSKFSLSHYKLLSQKMGILVPISWYEALPGDTIQMSTAALIRCAPLVTPVMHPVHVRIHHWFVPNRIIWDDWEKFITGGPDGMDATAHPYINFAAAPAVSSLADYMGIPTSFGTTTNLHVSALPFRAYALIFNEWYRDQDLVTELALSKGNGADSTTNLTLANCAWEKDYYTSSRPWEQKGPTVTLPIAGNAPVTGIGVGSQTFAASGTYYETSGAQTWGHGNNASNPTFVKGSAASGGLPEIYADLSAVTGVDINTVRQAFALQRFEEARARYGSRYTEYLRYLGVRSSDARLQRPEYLGGGRQTIQFSEVLQTSETGTSPQGNLAGHGISALRSNRFRRFFEEHGIVMTLMSVRPRTIYSNSLNRGFLRGLAVNGMSGTKEDYWQRELQHIGQQEVNGLEVDVSAGDSSFGFQDRYDEYRRLESCVAGQFRTTLDNWHLARVFGSPPALNSTFVQCVPTTRVFADETDDNLYVMAQHSVQARRLVSQVGTSMTF
nr:MAG: major capsid protein [Microvirus sp.]